MGGPENGNFLLLYVMSLHSGLVVLKSLKTPLRNIKMVPYIIDSIFAIVYGTHKVIAYVK